MKEDILRLRSEGKSYSEIQKELGCSPGTISYHCSLNGKQNAAERSKRQERSKCSCGKYKSRSADKCKNCQGGKVKERSRVKREQIYNSTIEEYFKDYTTNTKHAAIRRLARVFMEESGAKKECKICGFIDYVEVCHIKAIKDFDKSAKIKEVNALENLVYLCPNHHKLLDTGKFSL